MSGDNMALPCSRSDWYSKQGGIVAVVLNTRLAEILNVLIEAIESVNRKKKDELV